MNNLRDITSLSFLVADEYDYLLVFYLDNHCGKIIEASQHFDILPSDFASLQGFQNRQGFDGIKRLFIGNKS